MALVIKRGTEIIEHPHPNSDFQSDDRKLCKIMDALIE